MARVLSCYLKTWVLTAGQLPDEQCCLHGNGEAVLWSQLSRTYKALRHTVDMGLSCQCMQDADQVALLQHHAAALLATWRL